MQARNEVSTATMLADFTAQRISLRASMVTSRIFLLSSSSLKYRIVSLDNVLSPQRPQRTTIAAPTGLEDLTS